tara:strand:- start:1341 stop:1877 length:537 start_codon:yes stop_codon:yes gene_type:complete
MTKLLSYIDHLQKQNADDLAFYPLTTLEAALEDRRILTCLDNGESAGYLWHGPARTGFDIVIYQACVDYDSRKRDLGFGMVSSLIALGKAAGSNGIRLRCASSSESNEFWQTIGFYCTKVSKGGVKRSREINHWRTDIQVPLFSVEPAVPSTVAIDLKSYQQQKREGVKMPNRWERNH